MTDIPPGRYRVVERDRRLIVIDTRTGKPVDDLRPTRPAAGAGAPPPAAPPAPLSSAPRRVDDRSGQAVFTTSRFYDLKGPREIVLTDRAGISFGSVAIGIFVFGATAVLFFPWLWLAPVIALLQPRVRAAIRQWITARLDEVDQAAS